MRLRMFERPRRKGKVKDMVDERSERANEQADGKPDKEITEKLGKSEVDEVAGGSGKQSYDKPPELPEIL